MISDFDSGFAGCPRIDCLDDSAWNVSKWISVPGAKIADSAEYAEQNAAPGTGWFVTELENKSEVKSAKWMTTGLGVYEIYINGGRVGSDALKPGFTHVLKTRRAFTYDVTSAIKKSAGEKNVFAAEVSAGWWRDKIVHYRGKKSAFRGVLEITYANGKKRLFGTDTKSWKCAEGGPVLQAGIFDGERYDARIAAPRLGGDGFRKPEENTEFKGEILPTCGAEVCRRFDIAIEPVTAYLWKDVEGAGKDILGREIFGKVVKSAKVDFKGDVVIPKGEHLIIDFGQNCAGVPLVEMKARSGAKAVFLFAEMLNDENGERTRGNDGPGGSLYRENLRMPFSGMRAEYTFGKGGKFVNYMPRFTFFGYRYVSVAADAELVIRSIRTIPVTSIAKEMEIGRIKTGSADINKLVSNVYWGQLSNYLSVTTDCPQRNERLGWTADTQVFTEAGSFNANTARFFHKWTRDIRDCQHELGGYPGVAPLGQYGNEPMRIGWADAGVIVPYKIWQQFGDTAIVEENWSAMEKYLARCAETKYEYEATKNENGGYQWADWLSYEPMESCSGRGWDSNGLRPETIVYWNYLGACYWMWDSKMMAAMGKAIGKDSAKYLKMADDAKAYLKANFFAKDGLVVEPLRGLQTPAIFALTLDLVEGKARKATLKGLTDNIHAHGDCLQSGFLGTSIIMDTLTANGRADVAYTLLMQHKNPSWLYSVDQGATTIWERWNSYVKETGFGPVGMNSFNHYAYGAVLAWIYKSVAGIATDKDNPGFKKIVLAPKPDKRIGFVEAEYNSASGLIKSAWRYKGGKCIWDFTIPEGATATVVMPGTEKGVSYEAGTYRIEIPSK